MSMEQFASYVVLPAFAVGVFIDARSRRSRVSWLWALGTWLLGLLVIPLWYAIRPLHAGERREGGRLHNGINAFGLLVFVGFQITVVVFSLRVIGRALTGQRGLFQSLLALWEMGWVWWLGAPALGLVFLILSTWTKKDIVEHGPTGRLAAADPRAGATAVARAHR